MPREQNIQPRTSKEIVIANAHPCLFHTVLAGLDLCVHRGFSGLCPALMQRLPVNFPLLILHLDQLQLESCLFIPIYYKSRGAEKNVGRIKSNLTGEKKGGGGQMWEGREGQEEILELGCKRREQVPPKHLLSQHILQRAQAFHAGVMLAACSPCADKGKPDLLRAKTAAPAPRVPWKPTPAAVTLPSLAGSTKCHSWLLDRLIQTNPLRGYPNELAAIGLDGLQADCS